MSTFWDTDARTDSWTHWQELLLFSRSVVSDSLQHHVCSTPGFPVLHISQSLLKLMSTESGTLSNHLNLCHPLLLLLSIFPSIKVFSNEPALWIRWPEYWSFSVSIVLLMNNQEWFPLGLMGLISLQSRGLSRDFSNTRAQKHQFFNIQPCLWSNSHIHTWPLEKPWLWLYGPSLTK